MGQTAARKSYTLVVIDAPDIERGRLWLEAAAERLGLETVFVATMTGRPPLSDPTGLAALVSAGSRQQMSASLAKLDAQLASMEGWTASLMRAEWIEPAHLGRSHTTKGMTRRVGSDGRVRYGGDRYFVSYALRGEDVDLVDHGSALEIYYGGTLVKKCSKR